MCEAYKKIAASRSKKKSPSKKEKEVFIETLKPRIIDFFGQILCDELLFRFQVAWKAIKDREAILKQLEGS